MSTTKPIIPPMKPPLFLPMNPPSLSSPCGSGSTNSCLRIGRNTLYKYHFFGSTKQ
ncbi:hypothetical protein WG66_016647, partial [Moniliophthora roreri]